MRVLFITHNYPRSAGDYSGVFLHTLARRLAAEDVSVTVVAPHDAGAAERETLDGIEIHRIRYAPDARETFAYRGDMHRQLVSLTGPWRFWRFLRGLRRGAVTIARSDDFDLVAANWAIPCAGVARAAAQAIGVSLVVHSHGTDVRLLARFAAGRWFAGEALRNARRWTVVSSYLRELALGAFPALANKIEVCPLPNDEHVFYHDESITRDKRKIVAVTRFIPQKKVDVLLDACAALRERNVEFELDIYGAGPGEAAARERITQLALADRVQIYPPVPQRQLRAIYSGASIVVLNSIGEGFGLALVEGALCGALPIGAAAGGITDIIEHEKTGLLVEPGSISSLSEALARALTDDQLRTRLAGAAQENAERRFTGQAVARRFAEVYRGAVDEHNKAARPLPDGP